MKFKNAVTGLALVTLMLLMSCAMHGEKMRSLEPGLNTAQVEARLGRPDGVRRVGAQTVWTWSNRMMSGWSNARADYHAVFEDERLQEWGAGSIRESRPGVIVIVPVGG